MGSLRRVGAHWGAFPNFRQTFGAKTPAKWRFTLGGGLKGFSSDLIQHPELDKQKTAVPRLPPLPDIDAYPTIKSAAITFLV